MNDKISYLDQPCERCGSKKSLSKIHKEWLTNLSGTSQIEYSQIICTKKVCQEEFEEKLLEKTQKDLAIKLKREEAKAAMRS